jgi:hypothetical protein
LKSKGHSKGHSHTHSVGSVKKSKGSYAYCSKGSSNGYYDPCGECHC